MWDEIEWNTSEHTTLGSLTSSLLDKTQLTKTCHPRLPITYHILPGGPFFCWQQSQKKGIPFHQLQKNSPLWNQSLTVKALFKWLWLSHYNNGYKNTEWQIILDIQMTPFKFSVMSLIKLRWALAFPEWHRYANDLYGGRRPFGLQALHSAFFWSPIPGFESTSGLSHLMPVRGWENVTAALWHQPRLALVKCW